MLTRLLIIFVVATAPNWIAAQEYDDPAIVVCELLVRPQYEIEQNTYKRIFAAVLGAKAVLDFEWGVIGARPKSEHAECPFRLEAGAYVLDIPADQQEIMIPAASAISASGLYPITPTETALH